ncbi:hypothetical protein [Streptomyces sp. NBC_00236]|uniref:hypothetical protein n=1 Tax=Streptomyces sp. NBC_00236 TaxID=2903639 RepID=UPI002E2B28D9|nr:hypothetical protein [Streptomyces sp. NBC_00236]
MTSPTDFKNMFNRSAADHTTDFQKAMDASRAKPEQIREAHDRQVEKIRAREDITPQARQVAMARAHRDTAAKLEAAQQADRQKYETRRAQLEKRLFGSDTNVTGTEAINRRQAREMAANLTDPQEAQAAYSRALRDGDRDYARAIASHAADQAAVPLFGAAWASVLDAHSAATPGYDANLAEFRSLQEPGGYGDTTYMAPAVPSELGRLSPHQVAMLADSDLTVHGNDGPEAA